MLLDEFVDIGHDPDRENAGQELTAIGNKLHGDAIDREGGSIGD